MMALLLNHTSRRGFRYPGLFYRDNFNSSGVRGVTAQLLHSARLISPSPSLNMKCSPGHHSVTMLRKSQLVIIKNLWVLHMLELCYMFFCKLYRLSCITFKEIFFSCFVIVVVVAEEVSKICCKNQ